MKFVIYVPMYVFNKSKIFFMNLAVNAHNYVCMYVYCHHINVRACSLTTS